MSLKKNQRQHNIDYFESGTGLKVVSYEVQDSIRLRENDEMAKHWPGTI